MTRRLEPGPERNYNFQHAARPAASRHQRRARPAGSRSSRVRPRLESFSQTSPRVALLALQATCVRRGFHYRSSPVAAMLSSSLLRRPGLSRLVRQVRAYAEAAAAPAPAAGPGQMSFTFASPTQVFFNGANVRQVDVPTQTGAFGILAAHVPTLQVLRPGLVVVHAEDGTTSKYFVSSGSVTVNADSSVQLLAEEAVTLDMLDLGAAKANLEKAQSELSGAADEVARAEIQIRMEASEALVKALE